jgi:O-antigen/teichoic acid export membrane protein
VIGSSDHHDDPGPETSTHPGSAQVRVRSSAKIVRRLGWGLADQGLSSLTNFALGVVLARTLTRSEFGAYGIAFGVYILGLGFSRALASEPLMVRYSAATFGVRSAAIGSATGAALWVGILAGTASILAGTLIENDVLARSLLALGVCLPGLLLQDAWRFAFFAGQRGAAALLNDLAWGTMLAVALTVMLSTGERTAGSLILAWGVTGSVAAVIGVLQARERPKPSQTLGWIREHRDLIPRFAGEFGVTTLAAQISIFAIGAISGLVTVAGIRAGQLVFGPLNVLFLGVGLAGLPEAARLARQSKDRLRHACVVLSVGLATCALTIGIVAFAVPTELGVALMGDNWAIARDVILPIAIWMAGFGVSLGAGIGLRALAAARLSLRARIVIAPLAIVGAVVGAVAAAAEGAAWGFAVAYSIGAVVWWWYFARALHAVGHNATPREPTSAFEDVGFPEGPLGS